MKTRYRTADPTKETRVIPTGAAGARHRRASVVFRPWDMPLWFAVAERNLRIAEGKPVGRRSR